MKKIALTISLALISILAIQCGSNEIEKLEQDVLALHDTVMVEMQDLRSVQKQLDERLAEMDSLPGDSIDEGRLIALQNAKATISASYKEMMDWMSEYNKPTGDVTDDEVIAYLNEQYERMKSIREKMQNGLADAAELINGE